MINSVLTGAVAGVIVLVGLLASAGVIYYAIRRKIERVVISFLVSPTPDTASPFALLVSSIAGTFGSEISASLKATFMGLQSVEAKNASRAAAASVIQGNPLLTMIISSFPAVGRKLRNNPALAGLADIGLSKVMAGRAAGGETGNHQLTGFDKF